MRTPPASAPCSSPDAESPSPVQQTLRTLSITFAGCLGVVGVWLFVHQALGCPSMIATYREQIIRRIHLPASRGNILDCTGVPIRANAPSHKFVLYLDSLLDPRMSRDECLRAVNAEIVRFAKLFDAPTYRRFLQPRSQLAKALDATAPMGLVLNEEFEPSDTTIAIWGINRTSFPHIRLERWERRVSAFPGCWPFIVGSVRLEEPIGQSPPGPPSESAARDHYHLYQKEMTGTSGIESQRESTLRGTAGVEEVVVTATGVQRVAVLSKTDPVPGRPVYTTLCLRLQRLGLGAFFADGACGAFAITTVADGAIRAVGSSPAPGGVRNASTPLANRAFLSLYSPGSTVKPLLDLAFLASGRVSPDDTVVCSGKYRIGTKLRGCDHVHSVVTMRSATCRSCNCYFEQTGWRVGPAYLHHWLRIAYGLNSHGDAAVASHPHIRMLPAKVMGPGQNGTWERIENWLLCIGQGDTEVTMPVLANATAALATGVVFRPHLFSDGPDGGEPVASSEYIVGRLPSTPEMRAQVLEGMIDVVHDPRGTGRRARVRGIEIACKTGTAEKMKDGAKIKNTLMVALVPARAPRYAIAAVIEDGVFGGVTVAPRIKAMVEGMLAEGFLSPDDGRTNEEARQ